MFKSLSFSISLIAVSFSAFAISPLHSSLVQVQTWNDYKELNQKKDSIQALASLTFHAEQLLDEKEDISFSEEERELLAEKVLTYFSLFSGSKIHKKKKHLFKKAHRLYDQAKEWIAEEKKEAALKVFKEYHLLLLRLWEESCEEEFLFDLSDSHSFYFAKKLEDPHLEKNPYLPKKIKNHLRPYLLPLHHRMRPKLDALFCEARVTQNRYTFHDAGFRVIARGPRSFINVAQHKQLPGYLVKAYFDNETQKKGNKSSWEWLIQRCQGADKIRKIIRNYDIKHFVVPKKWIYCLPPEPSPPSDIFHTRHFALLLVTNMNLAPESHNYYAWSHKITKEHLDELYIILSRAKGSSYRPDNIAYTKTKQFAFIDTEYPKQGPDYKRIRPYLNKEMREYWDQLVKKGGS